MARKSTGTATKGRGVVVDFSGTDSRGGKKGARSARVPPNDYAVKVIDAKMSKSPDKETPEIRVTYRITRGKYKGKTIIDDLYLTPKALWRVRQTYEACGVKVPSKKVRLNPSALENKECAITVEDDEYENKVRSRVVDTFLLSDFEESEAEEDEETDEEDEDEAEDEEEEEEEDETEEESDEDDELEDVDLDEI
jgi:type III secretory pathway component EscV